MRQSRIREALGKIYDQHPPELRDQLRRFQEDPKSRIFAPLAEGLRRLGRIEEAIEIAEKGIRFHPEFPSGRLALARCYFDKKKFKESKDELKEVIRLAPDNLMAQKLLGEAYLILEDRKSAIHHFKMALLLAPSDVALHEKVHGLETEIPAVIEEPNPLPPLSDFDSLASTLPQTATHGFDKGDEFEIAEKSLWIETNSTAVGFEDEPDENTKTQINKLLGLADNDDEDSPFKSEPFSKAFMDKERERNKEITTETLADLYLSQGQTEDALSMLEKLYKKHPSEDLLTKIQKCRVQLGVDDASLVRQRQIEMLRGVLRRQRNANK